MLMRGGVRRFPPHLIPELKSLVSDSRFKAPDRISGGASAAPRRRPARRRPAWPRAATSRAAFLSLPGNQTASAPAISPLGEGGERSEEGPACAGALGWGKGMSAGNQGE